VPAPERPTRPTDAEAVQSPRGSPASTAADTAVMDDAPDGTPSSSAAETLTPDDVVYASEIRRSRAFASFASIIATAASIAVLLDAGDPVAARVFWACCGVCIAGGLAWLWVLRDPAAYRRSHGALFGYLAIIAIGGAFYYFGPHSAVVMVVPLGGFMFSLGQSRAAVIGMAAAICVVHAGVYAGILTGILEDRGVLPLRGQRHTVSALVLIQLVFIASFVLGRVVRRSTLELIERRDQALREAAQREALLDEARLELAHALNVGDVGRYTELTVGSYRLGRVIGRGAMGEVYEGVHLTTGELAAVKLLLPQAMADEALVQRFLREIELAAALDDAHVVRVLEVPPADATVKYFAMERLRGGSLAEILRHVPRLEAAEAIEMMQQLGAGVTAAHEAGIVHRDLKPRNVFRHQETERRHTWKVLDFGISKLISHDGTLTDGRLVGTPGYMAPEQAMGLDVDYRADVYALSAIAYRALTGNPAFRGPDVATILYAVVHLMPVRPSDLAPLPREVDDVLSIGLAKDPSDRFEDAGALADALEAALSGQLAPALQRRVRRLQVRHPWRGA
jgi:eukaryotic-like serine/threonine-protein kinase